MADYYPLLARAVAGLPNSTAETRRAIYERARKALIGQLKAIEPPIAEADIARENDALDAAAARLEAEIAGKAAVAAQDEPQSTIDKPTPPPPAPPPKAPQPPPPPAPPKPFSFRPPDAIEADKADRAEKEPEQRPEGEAPSTDDEAADLESVPSLKPPRPREAPRPAAPGPATQNGRGNRLWIVGGVVVGIVLLVAELAIKLKGRPEDLARLRPAPAAQGDAPQSGKIVERVGGDTQSAPAQKSETKPAPSAAAQGQPPVPVAHRAALLIEAPDTPEKVKTYIGSVVWRLDNVPGGAGQPLGTAIHADVDIPDAKVRMTVDIQKNMDATLNASHTIEVRFSLLPGSAIPGVKQIGAVQMRREDMANGDPLAGVPVPITETYYLIGLQRGDIEARNVDLLKTRGWLDVPLALSNGRIAKFSLEKGVSGDRVINDALSTWGASK